jgi:hypothetical protein
MNQLHIAVLVIFSVSSNHADFERMEIEVIVQNTVQTCVFVVQSKT